MFLEKNFARTTPKKKAIRPERREAKIIIVVSCADREGRRDFIATALPERVLFIV